MKLKKLFAVEIVAFVIILVLIMIFIEFTPYLASASQNNSIGVYNEKVFASGNLTLAVGESAGAQFNYSTFDPAILVVDLTFQNWQTPGYLSVYCNGLLVSTVLATPQTPQVELNILSLSGLDIVKPRSAISYYQLNDVYTYGNEITFRPQIQNGYEGTFAYKIMIRGTR